MSKLKPSTCRSAIYCLMNTVDNLWWIINFALIEENALGWILNWAQNVWPLFSGSGYPELCILCPFYVLCCDEFPIAVFERWSTFDGAFIFDLFTSAKNYSPENLEKSISHFSQRIIISDRLLFQLFSSKQKNFTENTVHIREVSPTSSVRQFSERFPRTLLRMVPKVNMTLQFW